MSTNRISRWLNAKGGDGAFLMATKEQAKVAERAAMADALSHNLQWECKNADITPTGGAVFKALQDKGIKGGSEDSIAKHLAGTQDFSTKRPAASILAAYAELFGYLQQDSILSAKHIRRRKEQLTKKTTDLTSNVTFAKTASVDDAHATLDRLWNTPHRSLAAYLLKYLDSD